MYGALGTKKDRGTTPLHVLTVAVGAIGNAVQTRGVAHDPLPPVVPRIQRPHLTIRQVHAGRALVVFLLVIAARREGLARPNPRDAVYHGRRGGEGMGVGGGGGHHAGWGLGGPRGRSRSRRVARGSRGASDAGGAFAAGAADLAQAKVCHGMNRGRGGAGRI